MKNIALILLLAITVQANAQLYKSNEGNVSFFSKAPLEDIDANSKNIVSAINTATNEIAFSVGINSFLFKKEKMKQDFEEDYLQSDKYPEATYKGKISGKINWGKDGSYQVTSKGTLTIHGVGKERTDTATVTIKDGRVSLKSSFLVTVADYNIKIPELVFKKIAEVVAVKLEVSYLVFKEEKK
jgi:FlaG/FlaF family flagellin (archaellin)